MTKREIIFLHNIKIFVGSYIQEVIFDEYFKQFDIHDMRFRILGVNSMLELLESPYKEFQKTPMADYTSKEALNRNGAGKALGNYKGGIRKALLKRNDLRDTYKKLNKQLIKQTLQENGDKILMNRIDLSNKEIFLHWEGGTSKSFLLGILPFNSEIAQASGVNGWIHGTYKKNFSNLPYFLDLPITWGVLDRLDSYENWKVALYHDDYPDFMMIVASFLENIRAIPIERCPLESIKSIRRNLFPRDNFLTKNKREKYRKGKKGIRKETGQKDEDGENSKDREERLRKKDNKKFCINMCFSIPNKMDVMEFERKFRNNIIFNLKNFLNYRKDYFRNMFKEKDFDDSLDIEITIIAGEKGLKFLNEPSSNEEIDLNDFIGDFKHGIRDICMDELSLTLNTVDYEMIDRTLFHFEENKRGFIPNIGETDARFQNTVIFRIWFDVNIFLYNHFERETNRWNKKELNQSAENYINYIEQIYERRSGHGQTTKKIIEELEKTKDHF